MARPEKVQAVADIKERIESAEAVFFTEYAGLDVKQQQQLRRNLRAADSEYRVVKMTLARRAADELGLDEVEELLFGPTALAFAKGDPVTAAKALSDFTDDNAALLIKGALMSGDLLSAEAVVALAKVEPRETQLAKLAGDFQAPMANVAGVLSALLRDFASMFEQLEEAKPAGDAPEAVVDEPAAAATAEPEATGSDADDTPAETVAEEAAPDAADDEPAADAASEDEPAAEKAADDDGPPAATVADDEPAAEEAADDAAPEAAADEAAEAIADDTATDEADDDAAAEEDE
jgi:large subunit ribosomal protein L10